MARRRHGGEIISLAITSGDEPSRCSQVVGGKIPAAQSRALEMRRVAAPTRGSGSTAISWSSPILREISVRRRLLLPVLLEFGLALLAIVVAAAIFTNAVEILGGRLNLGDGAVGSVLAAVGTALPETMIPIVAVLAAFFAVA
jgi:hypothetical protein